ncbi:MAG: metal ABC transporter ATP-binding protein [Thermoproteota archaeon]|nr:metal ABC transporter ATP-binding protein [Thermoproteota archaeon]
MNEDEHKIVTIKNLNLRSNSDIILDDVSFEINRGDFLGIIGPNGAGKTTLFKCMLGLNKDYSGTIRIFNKEIKKESKEIYKKIGYITQSNNFDPRFPATVKEIIQLGTIGKKIGKEKMDELLDLTGVSEYLDKRIGDLSGGQQQRVMITKALIHEPELLILDEPATAVDANILKLFYKLLIKLNKEKKITIIWSSHDLDAVNLLSNKIACIYKKLLFHGRSEDFFSDENNLKKFTESAMHIHIKSHYH